VISAFDAQTFTVSNQGTAAAGPFSVEVVNFGAFSFTGLAAGGRETRTYASGCAAGTLEARADYLNQVVESNETNSTRSIDVIC